MQDVEVRRAMIDRLQPYLEGAERAAANCLEALTDDRVGGMARTLIYHQHVASFLRKLIADLERGIPGTDQHERQRVGRLRRIARKG